MDEPVIRVENVSKDFVLPHEKVNSVKGAVTSFYRRNRTKETQHALKNISLQINKGEFFGIVGRNGSGKSTLLKMLAGIYQPTSGNIDVRGKLVPFIELGVGFNPELTGRENVYLNGAMMGFSKKETDAIYEEIVEFAELKDFMDQKLKNYSSGMQVRLAFSVAVKVDADILLIDEVLAVGDAAFQRKCYDYFRSLKREGKTVVFVTHDMEAVRQFCDRAAVIEASKLQTVSDPRTIAGEYEKLFSWRQASSESTQNRWGSGSLKVVRAILSSDKLSPKDKMLGISTEIKANQSTDDRDYWVGVRVMNAMGQNIFEVTTRNLDIKLPPLKKGQNINLNWQSANLFVDGSYTVDVYIRDNNEIADSWTSAARFSVLNPRFRGSSLIEPPVKVEVK